MGWETTVTEGSADKGIDVIATKGEPFETKQLIQAKRYSADSTVGSPQIQQYASLRHQEANVDAVVVVTTSTFSRQAEEIAADLNVKLIDGVALEHLITKYECEELVLRYADPAAVSSEKSVSSTTEGRPETSDPRPGTPDPGADSVDSVTADGESQSKYGSRMVHIVIAALTVWWTLGLGNAAYAAWSYHKAKYGHDESNKSKSNVSDTWYIGVVAAVLASGAVYAIGLPLSGILPGVLDPLLGFIMFTAWILLPVSMYFDIQYVRDKSEWNPVTGLWLIGAVLLVVNLVVGLAYLMRRKNAMGNDRFSALDRSKIEERNNTKSDPSDPVSTAKNQYIEGELDEQEFNRELERLLEPEDKQVRDNLEKSDFQTDQDQTS